MRQLRYTPLPEVVMEKARKEKRFSRYSASDRKIVDKFLKTKFPEGIFNAQQVLDLARPKTSPIHRFFTWNDSDAAEKYRLDEARALIACVVVEIDDQQVRKYVTPVRLEAFDTRMYVEINRARSDRDIWDQVLTQAMKDAMLWAKRYEKLRDLSEIRLSIARTNQKLEKRRTDK